MKDSSFPLFIMIKLLVVLFAAKFVCSKTTIETPEKSVKYAQSSQ